MTKKFSVMVMGVTMIFDRTAENAAIKAGAQAQISAFIRESRRDIKTIKIT